MNKSLKLKSGIFSLALVFLTVAAFSTFSNTPIEAAEEADTIAVRIAPNPNHFSISRWYENQGFLGSPQALTVDGYEAIRDGRTVYVNAANVVSAYSSSGNNYSNSGSNYSSGNNYSGSINPYLNSGTIYTNVYMISYSQEPSEKTVDILGQVVSHWAFNDGLKDDEPASCSISAFPCINKEDCAKGQFCSASGLSTGSCSLETPKNCSIDEDCPTGFFCDSKKAIITRDIKRLGRLDEMRTALANYRDNNGRFPVLSAGTYLPNKSVSLWPSWQQNFLADIAIAPSYVDPINRLGYCPGFDKATCWNKDTKAFVYNPQGNVLKLPEGSYAFLYSNIDGGVDYNLCAVLETKSIGYNFSPSYASGSACVTGTGISAGGNASNTAPTLVDSYLVGQKDKEFNGFIKVSDADNDNLTWSIVDVNVGSSWSDRPVLIDTSNKFQKKVYAPRAGAAAVYPIKIKVDDGRRGISFFDLSIEITEPGIFIEAPNASHVLDKDTPFEYSFYVSGDNLPKPLKQNNVVVKKVSGPGNINPSFFVPNGEPVLVSDNRYRITYKGSMPPAQYQIPDSVDLGFEITINDNNNKQSKKRFEIQIISEKPAFNFSCPLTVRVGNDYSCLLGTSKQFNHDITYSLLDGLPYDLKIVNGANENNGNVYISGRVYNTSGNAVYYTSGVPKPISLRATNEYGAYTNKGFGLKMNTFCGDGTKQSPNSEGRGGPYNDGYEDCDGVSGIASSPSESGPDKQYKCATIDGNTPYEISSDTYCVFAYPLNGGGYCGDEFCQTKKENKGNCSVDCGGNEIVVVQPDCTVDSDCLTNYYCNIADGTCVERTCSPMIDDNGNSYGAALVAGRCLTSKGVNIGTMLASGKVNPNINDKIIEKWCYNNDPKNCDTYGGLYAWEEAMRGSKESGARGVCGPGWHIPTNDEYNIIAKALPVIKDNSSILGSIYGGFHTYTGTFYDQMGTAAMLWTSIDGMTSVAGHSAGRRYMYSLGGYLSSDFVSAREGFSVRCIQDVTINDNINPVGNNSNGGGGGGHAAMEDDNAKNTYQSQN